MFPGTPAGGSPPRRNSLPQPRNFFARSRTDLNLNLKLNLNLNLNLMERGRAKSEEKVRFAI
eukprot:1095381-Prorocentrum_minimum.AAC.1